MMLSRVCQISTYLANYLNRLKTGSLTRPSKDLSLWSCLKNVPNNGEVNSSLKKTSKSNC